MEKDLETAANQINLFGEMVENWSPADGPLDKNEIIQVCVCACVWAYMYMILCCQPGCVRALECACAYCVEDACVPVCHACARACVRGCRCGCACLCAYCRCSVGILRMCIVMRV